MKKFIYTFSLLFSLSAASFAQETKKEGSIKLINQNATQQNLPTPLFILDDVEMPGNDLGSIKSEDIESINVLKEKKTIESYGEKGKNGVVIIYYKKVQGQKIKRRQVVC